MMRKTVISFLMAFFLLAVCGPITGHDGSMYILNEDPSGDEHPWGDENYTTDMPIIGSGGVDLSTTSTYSILTTSVYFSFLRISKFYTDYTSSPDDRMEIDARVNNSTARTSPIIKSER